MTGRGFLQAAVAVIVFARLWGAAPPSAVLHSDLHEKGWFKVCHGYIVQFDRSQKVSDYEAIETFDPEGRRILGVDVLKQLKGAAQADIDDIALLPGKSLVAAAIVRKGDGSIHPMLLYFDWSGSLVRGVDLPPGQEINNLELDKEGNLWALADYSGRKEDETNGSLVYVYDREGRLTKSLLRRSDYPAGFREGPQSGGVVGFGLTDDGFWFWQPVSHTITMVSREGKVLKRMPVPIPKFHVDKTGPHPADTVFIDLLPSGQIVAELDGNSPDVPPGARLFEAKHLVRTYPPELRLIGVDGPDMVFLNRYQPSTGIFDVLREPVPPRIPR
jgi:hypothetical protein